MEKEVDGFVREGDYKGMKNGVIGVVEWQVEKVGCRDKGEDW